ncbi:MAG: type II toxin-antitoxin system VapC family toxin [Gemmatimonadales bacterium]
MGLIDDLGSGAVACDTAVFIYFIEDHATYAPILAPLFRAADRGARPMVTSALTLLEVLVAPYRVGNLGLAARYEALLTRGRGLRLVDLDRPQLRGAAQLRALYALRTPDALQLGAALSAGCSAFLTNDRRLPSLPSLRILQLRDYVPPLPKSSPRAQRGGEGDRG